MKRALGTEYARNLLCRPAELAGKEETRAGGLGGLCDGHLRVDGEQADRGDDDVCAGERLGERGHVGVLGGRDAHAARSEGFVCLFVAGFLFFVDRLAPSGRGDGHGSGAGRTGRATMVISSMARAAFCLSSSSTMKPPTLPAPMIANFLKLDMIWVVGMYVRRRVEFVWGYCSKRRGWGIYPKWQTDDVSAAILRWLTPWLTLFRCPSR